MSIGNGGLTKAQLDQLSSQIAGQWVALARQAAALQAYVVGQGTAGLTAMGYGSADAASMQQQCNYMSTLAGVVQGAATQATTFNFVSALVPLTGPFA
jgi:hypothetical protein